jgi:tether containing UBX domain for GLUT4
VRLLHPEVPLRLADQRLRNQNKQIDLSRTIRLSGLTSGAKLELVQSSRSPTVVSVALQLPEGEARGIPNARLTDKFPSTTTLWLLLRKFEAGVAGTGGTKRNLTARGAPRTNDGSSGQGRLYYETPVLQVMGRELSSFADLQKTLGQLGFNSGSVLLKLSFRISEMPLEEAMRQIEEYFKATETPNNEPLKSHAISKKTTTDKPDPEPSDVEATQSEPAPAESPNAAQTPNEDSTASAPVDERPAATEAPIVSSSGRTLQVFAPPTSTTPSAALASHNPADYTPTIEHAQKHQRLLSESSRNIRLPSEAEIAAKAASEQERLAAVKYVEIKIRFPDESAVSARFSQADTCASLYKSVRECLDEKWVNEPFILRQPGIRGKSEVVPDDEKKLIQGLGLKGRVLVIFGWDDKSASIEARSEKRVLKASLRQQARPIEVQEINGADDGEDRGIRVSTLKESAGESKEEDKGKRKGGMPKWLKGLSKK